MENNSIRCNVPILQSLTEEEKQEFLVLATLIEVQTEEAIIEEGEIGHSMYVIKSGKVRVLTTTETGQAIILANLETGECFGEQAVLAGRTEDKREISVIAVEPTKLLKIALSDFQSILSKDSDLQTRLQQITEDKIRNERIKKSAQLTSTSILDSGGMEWLEEQKFVDGEIVFQQGDTGDRFYLILQGIAKVTKQEGGKEKIISRLSRGQYFGEMALIRDEPRPVTITAEGTLRVNSYTGSLTHKAVNFSMVDNLTYQPPRKANSGEAIAYKHYGVDELSFQIGPLVGITAFGEWPDVGHVHGPAIADEETENVRHDLIKESSLFKSLPSGGDSVEWLEELKFNDGSVIFREGDIADRFYLIISGMAKVTKQENGYEKLVALLCRGQYFGEVALIRNEPRVVTVTAEGPLCVASLKGLITFHTSKFMDMDSLTTMYHFSQGEKIVSTKVVDAPVFDVTKVGAVLDTPYIYKRSGIRRELFFQNGSLVGMTTIGEWPDLGRVHQLIIRNQRVWPWQRALFKLKGELWLEQERESFKDNAVICKCTGVTRGVLNQAAADDCDTVEKLAERTGASKVCGSCSPLLAEIVGHSDMEAADIISVLPVTSEVKSFCFKPRHSKVLPNLPGQHIRIEGQIDGHWVQRAYTLTSSAEEYDYYEITVKREEYGHFSRWLHDELNTSSLVKISKPQGSYYVPLDEETPVVCFGGGIGITPSLAILRTLYSMNSDRMLHIDYSAQTSDQFAYRGEFIEISSQQDNVNVNLRATTEQGFLQAEDVQQIIQNYPDANFYICGPKPFEQAVCNHLAAAKVPSDKIKTEQFVPAGGSTAALPKLKGAKSLLTGSILTLIVAVLFMALGPIPFSDSVQNTWQIDKLWTDSFWKQVSGYTILALTVIGMIMSFRKRWKKFDFGNFAWWRIMHLSTGLLALALLFIHTGMTLGEHFNFLLMISFLGTLIIGSGIGVLTFVESRLPEVTTAYQVKTWLKNTHIAIVWPLPVLVGIHIVLAYYF